MNTAVDAFPRDEYTPPEETRRSLSLVKPVTHLGREPIAQAVPPVHPVTAPGDTSQPLTMSHSRAYAVGKRTVDIVASAVLLLLLSPLLLLALIAIYMDSPGPAIFCQDRVGRGGKIFRLYKFRTMAFKPDAGIAWIVDADGQKRHKVPNDPRITRTGKWLRRTSVDELPQLLNIIRGDMSLIGPRPELVEIVRQYQAWQHERHIVRPGLTGWWQVSGRSDRPMHENTELDLYYVRGQSFRLDFLIALKTIRVVFKGLGAF